MSRQVSNSPADVLIHPGRHPEQRLQPAASLEDYLVNPVGFFIVGDNVAVFSAANVSQTVDGLSFWGRPGDADIEMIAATQRRDDDLALPSGSLLVDLRRLECIDLRVFSKLPSLLARRCNRAGQPADRLAVLRPEGVAGSIAAELFVTMSRGCPVRAFVDAREALDWLGVTQLLLIEDLERLLGASPDGPGLIGVLRKVLERSPSSNVRDVACQLGISARTLQRRLREMGTNFQRELDIGRLQIAKRLMRETLNPLKCIALEAGYVSPQHFSSAFHRHAGMSPGRWRAAHGARHPPSGG